METGRLIVIIIVIVVVALVLWLKIVQRKSDLRKQNPLGGTKDRRNYNLDTRRFRKEKLLSPKWWAWLVGGTIVALVPWLINQDNIGISIGLIFCWLVILIAVSGTVMLGYDKDALATFAKKEGFQYQPQTNEWTPGIALRSTTLFSKALAGTAEGVLTKATPAGSVWMFRYSFEYAPPARLSHRELYQYMVFAITTNERTLPEFIVDGGTVYDFDQFIPAAEREKVRLEGSFGDKYALYVAPSEQNDKRLLAMSVMTPEVMELYERYFGASSMIIENGTVIVLTRQDLYNDASYAAFYEGLEQFVDKIARQLQLHQDVNELPKA